MMTSHKWTMTRFIHLLNVVKSEGSEKVQKFSCNSGRTGCVICLHCTEVRRGARICVEYWSNVLCISFCYFLLYNLSSWDFQLDSSHRILSQLNTLLKAWCFVPLVSILGKPGEYRSRIRLPHDSIIGLGI